MTNFELFIDKLSDRLTHTLPGLEAQLSMAPITRREELNRRPENPEPRLSAVLVLFYPSRNQPRIIFMKRPVDNSVHSGQIAFPGGRVEPEDNTFAQTALREANEEVNVNPADIKIIGSLSKLHIPPSNFDVYPVIGYTLTRPDFKGNYEVDKLVEVNVAELMDPETKTTKTIHHRLGKLVDVPCYYIEGEIIWGATAMILGELLEILAD